MAYAPPTITAAGLQIPAYADIIAYYVAAKQSIYGSTIYLGEDSPDYQEISAFAAKVNDVMQAVQLVYNARSPITAVGSDLDSVVKLNGLVRGGATQSTCPVTLSGTAGSTITNGVCTDQAGNSWALPASITIGSGGTANATATCATPGPISASVNTITSIATPTAGWTSVTNNAAATLGQLVEADSALRARQAISVALPGLTMLQSTIAAIAATTGVTRYLALENPSGAVDSYGNPAHSITAVVEGGTDADVAQAIYSKRGIGCFTNGTTTISVSDPVNGTAIPISFDRPTYVPIFVTMTVHGQSGFSSSTLTAIQTAIVNYLNSLQIGESLNYSAIYFAAQSVMPNPSLPQFSVRSVAIGTAASPTGMSDISINFNEVAQGVIANVSVSTV
ncbi:MAG TPA: hypothetical protein VGM02_01460 [Acidobacteriaceae bacterium]|jgi:uncharacterized phage protein gp47/JayE